ncbi:MAG: hypothetical protein EPN48_11585 [Microbacteriaceae bacterium]|nr:MAG: hypothetical protein EPN48_11585 [Microbacteriaceae bacterium]
MRKPNSTVVILVGAVVETILAELDTLPNVRAASIRSDPPGAEREFVSRAHTAYVVHDHDPLQAVQDAWVGFFDETIPFGTIEVAVLAARAALRSEATALPDYYLVLDPDALSPTAKHWWFGALAAAAPSRVVPCGASAAGVARTLGRLPPGRWWPEPPDEWLLSLDRFAPDAGMAVPAAVDSGTHIARHRATEA